jgi:cytochrome c oxidase subunit 3
MATFETTYRPSRKQFTVNPVKFTLWLFLVTITMMFAAFTSSMIVGKPDAVANGTWFEFNVPFNFTISTITIVLSSITMQWAYFAAKKNNVDHNRLALVLTLVLGIVFIISQISGYKVLMAHNVYFTGLVKVGDKMVSPVSGSFFYAITAIHALHVIGGIIFLLFTLISSLRYRVHSKNMLRINLCTTYWHFIGVLWVYLFALLNIYR